MFQVGDPSIKLFGSDIHIHTPLNNSPIDSHAHTQIPPQLQAMKGFEESAKTEMGVPLKELSGKRVDAPKNAKAIRNINRSPALEKVFHGSNEDRTSGSDIDHQEKLLKKPDKVLPCPRCNSLETKFCYFNNYNVNQPRHFCKNCKRYWTAGGTIRNVPVGAGKRKTKHSAPQPCQASVAPDAVSVASGPVKGMGNIPSLRDVIPLNESLKTMLNIKGQKEFEADSSTVGDDNGEEPSSSSRRSAESMEKECSENGPELVGLTQNCTVFFPLHPLHYYPVPPWACQWSPCCNAVQFRPSSITSSPAYMGSPTMMAVPSFSPPKEEVKVLSPSYYWGCLPSWSGQKEEASFIGSTFSGIPSPSPSVSGSVCSGDRFPTLGKHSRDGSTLSDDAMKQNLWVPKTVRINDPKEAARSSLWSTLCTKPEQRKLIMKGSVFKSFEPKSKASSHVLGDNQILRANPAALTRSEYFQERM